MCLEYIQKSRWSRLPPKHGGAHARPKETKYQLHRDARVPRSIDLLHLRALVVVLLERRQLLHILGLVVVLDREAELDHAVDAAGEGGRLIEREARRQEGRLEEEVDEVLDGLVALVGGGLGLELLHDRVLRVDL